MTRAELKSSLFVVTWSTCAAVALFLPLLIFVISRSTNSADDYDAALYEKRQKQYQQAQQQYKEQVNNEYKHDDYWTDDWVYRKKYNDESEDCSYLWGCAYKASKENYQQSQEDPVPSWWIGDTQGEALFGFQVTLTIIYVFYFCVCAGIAMQGIMLALHEPEQVKSMSAMLASSCLFSFLLQILVLFIPGMIGSEGTALEENGWYGQVGILLFLTCFFWMIFSGAFAIIVRKQSARVSKLCYSPAEDDDYQVQDDPTVDTKKIVLRKLGDDGLVDRVMEDGSISPRHDEVFHTISYSPSLARSKSLPTKMIMMLKASRNRGVPDVEYTC